MYIEFKKGVKANEVGQLHPSLFHILSQINLYCYSYGIPLTITSLKSDRDKIKEQSQTHDQGRAFDIRTSSIPPLHRARLVSKLNRAYKNMGAIGSKSGASVVALDENDHIHIQVRPNAPIADLMDLH
jgi:hypothetical protein